MTAKLTRFKQVITLPLWMWGYHLSIVVAAPESNLSFWLHRQYDHVHGGLRPWQRFHNTSGGQWPVSHQPQSCALCWGQHRTPHQSEVPGVHDDTPRHTLARVGRHACICGVWHLAGRLWVSQHEPQKLCWSAYMSWLSIVFVIFCTLKPFLSMERCCVA